MLLRLQWQKCLGCLCETDHQPIQKKIFDFVDSGRILKADSLRLVMSQKSDPLQKLTNEYRH